MQIVSPCIEHVESLASFFRVLEGHGDGRFFYPHELTEHAAAEICRYDGKDYYCVVIEKGKVLAYGMLRGWDEGFDIPALGMAVAPQSRNLGTGRMLMHFLHFVARHRGCSEVMLKVEKENRAALHLYKSLGYVFTEHSSAVLVGRLLI